MIFSVCFQRLLLSPHPGVFCFLVQVGTRPQSPQLVLNHSDSFLMTLLLLFVRFALRSFSPPPPGVDELCFLSTVFFFSHQPTFRPSSVIVFFRGDPSPLALSSLRDSNCCVSRVFLYFASRVSRGFFVNSLALSSTLAPFFDKLADAHPPTRRRVLGLTKPLSPQF